MKRGKLIAIYGINNLGKSTQAKLLVDRINAAGRDVRYLKYPLYKLEPSGPVIEEYLRGGNKLELSPREFQILNVLNRTQYQPELQALLESGVHVVAEDYKGTGIAWGMGAGVDKEFLIRLNTHLLAEDVVFLFDGKRFGDGKEDGHTHEENDELTERARLAHLELAKDFGWRIVNANRPREEVHEEIWQVVKDFL